MEQKIKLLLEFAETEEVFLINKKRHFFLNGKLMKIVNKKGQDSVKETNLFLGPFSKIERLQWIPKSKDKYYCFVPGEYNYAIILRVWQDSPADLANFYNKNCFRSKEEANIRYKKLLNKSFCYYSGIGGR